MRIRKPKSMDRVFDYLLFLRARTPGSTGERLLAEPSIAQVCPAVAVAAEGRGDGLAFEDDRRAIQLADSAVRRVLDGADYGCCRASDSRSAT